MADSDKVWQGAALAHTYLEGIRGAIPMASEQIALVLRLVGWATPRVERVLDLGCGDGILGRAILAEHRDASAVFLDFSESMIAAARERIGDAASRARFVIDDFGDSRWMDSVRGDAPFDVVVSGFSIHHQPDGRKQEIYREIFNLLAPGGIFLNLEHVASATPRIGRAFDDLFIDALCNYHQGLGTAKPRQEIAQAYYHRPDKAANILATVEAQCTWLREIGYGDVDCSFRIFELALFGGVRPVDPSATG